MWKSESEVAQSCPTLSDPMDYSLPGSSIHSRSSSSRDTQISMLTLMFHISIYINACTLCTYKITAATSAKSLQSCPTLYDPIDGSPLGSSVPGILQARTLDRVAISFSNAGK